MVGLLDDDRVLDLRPRARRTDPGAVAAEERARRPPLPAANAALREWSEAGPDGRVPAPVGQAPAASDRCSVCGTRAAKVLCRNCGQGACTMDTWSLLGMCKRCVDAGRR
jgi:hypothetical protein